jgi:biopolymer transport protein ExbD
MFYRRMMIFPVLAAFFMLTACTALHSIDGASPEEMKKSELSKDDLWNQIKTLEKEKAVCQKQLINQESVLARMNSRLSDQQNEITRANQQIKELMQTIDGLSAKIKQLQESGKKETSPDSIHSAFTKDWGTIMYTKEKTNIRTNRSVSSKSRGSLMPGQTVKADFLKDDWYAVFKITEAERSEKNALGFVHAPRLFNPPFPETAPVASQEDVQPALDTPAQDIFSVAVKSIRHRVQPGGKEALLVEFDRFYVPAVYNVEGSAPMIVLDVTCTSSTKNEWSDIHTGGTLIRKIRATLNPTAGILRIVMHMTPDKDYDIKPTFYAGKDSKVYTLEVTGVTTKK